jgi:hypothetical protein
VLSGAFFKVKRTLWGEKRCRVSKSILRGNDAVNSVAVFVNKSELERKATRREAAF